MEEGFQGQEKCSSKPQVIVLRMSNKSMINYNYLIVDVVSKFSVIVDPAWEIEKIEEALSESKSELRGVLLTHSHADHIHLAGAVAKKYGCPVWMSKKEISTSGFFCEGLIGIDEEAWIVGDMLIQPIFTPGHTPGSVCYLIGDNLFTGDTLFIEGCGICPDIFSAHSLFYSLNYLRKWLLLGTKIFPGHSYGAAPGESFSYTLKNNIYLQIKNKHDFAAFRLRKEQERKKLFDFR